ncbi:hypothetical protein E2C01_052927 [Portunus trituberculatus]|uniref:Uncharacterized protein n=1 Tax=Portunus trituberculatus TaxID=210409 RepID=A0A5B7GN40_PORTR|nr:hypothetical protein [Portunus trituberculatus]
MLTDGYPFSLGECCFDTTGKLNIAVNNEAQVQPPENKVNSVLPISTHVPHILHHRHHEVSHSPRRKETGRQQGAKVDANTSPIR